MAEPDIIPESDQADGAPHPRHTLSLFGHDAAEAEFLRAVQSNRMHHAWLITGAKGIGKATFAWRAARYLLQGDFEQSNLNMDAEASVFRRTAALAEPRLNLCRRQWDKDKKRFKTVISVDDIRQLKSFFALSATDGGWRVAIIDAADDMNTAAANALLKILEEPPEKAAIFLVCHQPGRLLPTIRSRTVTLPLSELSPQAFAQALPDDVADADALYQLSGGAVGYALQLQQGGGLEIYEKIVATAGTLPNLDRQMVGALADAAAARNAGAVYEHSKTLLSFLITRAAKTAALGKTPPEAVAGEAALLTRMSPHSRAARVWAKLAQDIDKRFAHATAVNLDPALVILDTFLKVETATQSLHT